MRHPSAPPAIALLIGVVIGCRWQIPCWLSGFVMGVAWVLTGVIMFRRRPSPGRGLLFLASSLLAVLAAGASLGRDADWRALHTPLRAALIEARGGGDLANEPVGVVGLTGRLTEDAAPSASGGVRLVLDTSSLDVEARQYNVAGGVSLTVVGTIDPAAVSTWRCGRTVNLAAQLRRPARYLNDGVPDFEIASARRGTTLVGSVKSGSLVTVVSNGSAFDEWAAGLRAKARGALDAAIGRWDPRSAAVARAVILGDRTGLDVETEERLQRAGTYHVIAISGGNIAILAGLLFFILRWTTTATAVVETVVAVCLVGYAYLVGGGASVNRATLMAVMMLAAHAFDARGRPLNALGCAAALSLALDPLIIFDAGAWLTYGATIAIIVGAPVMCAALPRLRLLIRAAIALFVASLSAELALFPIAALVFSRVTAAGLVLNFAAIPLMSIVQVCGMGVLGVSCLSAALAGLLGRVTHLAAWGLVESARLVDVTPWVTTRVPPPEPWIIAIYYLAWLAWFALRHVESDPKNGAKACALAVVGAAGVWIVVAPVVHATATGRLSVTFVDVGQGDSTLIQFPTGESWMVDAGGATGPRFDIARRVIEPVVWGRGVRHLNRLVLTHGDSDHIGGAPSLLTDLEPAVVWEGTPVPSHEPLVLLRGVATRHHLQWSNVQRGDHARVGAVDVNVWHPRPPEWERQKVRNDDSVVVGFRYGDVLVVLAGDIEAVTEAELSDVVKRAPITIVQAPHHGSNSSSSAAWLQATRPAAVVMSVGRNNRFGHPGRATLERYNDAGAAVFRTDRDGSVRIVIDGRTAVLSTFNGRRLVIGPAGSSAIPPV